MKKSRNRRALDMGKLKPSGVLNWKKTANKEPHILKFKNMYAKEPNSQFVGEWKELTRKLRLFVSVDDHVLHMSISHPTRYPTWDEILRTRYKFFDAKTEMVMYMPKKEEYVNIHQNCFHLYELRGLMTVENTEPIGELVIEGAT